MDNQTQPSELLPSGSAKFAKPRNYRGDPERAALAEAVDRANAELLDAEKRLKRYDRKALKEAEAVLFSPVVCSNSIVQTDFVWGADQIGQTIGRTARQAHHLLSTGQIKSAKKKGGRWMASRAALLRELTDP